MTSVILFALELPIFCMDLSQLLSSKERLRRQPNITVTLPNGKTHVETIDGTRVGSEKGSSLGFVTDTSKDEELHEILAGKLYIGSQNAAFNSGRIVQLGITRILNVATGIETPQYPNVLVKEIPLLDLDSEDIVAKLKQTDAFIRESVEGGDKVLVHCNAGVSRAATVCISYLMQCHGMIYEEAYSAVKQTRPCICPNRGFVTQLKQLGKQIGQGHRLLDEL